MKNLFYKSKRQLFFEAVQKLIIFNIRIKRFWLLAGLAIFVGYGVSTISANADSPKAQLTKPAVVTPTPTDQEQSITHDIKAVFGPYYPKAMLLLKGDGSIGACHENGTLNPLAINRNWVQGEPGVYSSSDYGVFQINDKWQGVTNTNFLFDPAINIRMAWNIFKNNGYNFHLWTCGRVYGI